MRRARCCATMRCGSTARDRMSLPMLVDFYIATAEAVLVAALGTIVTAVMRRWALTGRGYSLIVALATLLFACSDEEAPRDAEHADAGRMDAGRMDAGTDAGSGGRRDAAADSGRMPLHQCPNGGWIPSKSNSGV